MSQATLAIDDLRLSFSSWRGSVEVLHGLSFSIMPGERMALVGESGSGKSVTARIILGLLQSLSSAKVTGSVVFDGQKLSDLNEASMHELRGTRMTMIFQDPTSSLNPVYRIGTQFHEVLVRDKPDTSAKEARDKASAMLVHAMISEPGRVLDSYPFQLSGGMNQRVAIAMALANRPDLLLADEPGTALDVTVQAQTLELMRSLVEENNTAVLFISHNLGVVREFADSVCVIYKGRIVERGPTAAIFAEPRHPYTRALMASVPRITGGGVPTIAEDEEAFSEPVFDHGSVA